MTLLELATFICGTVSQTEATDLAACRGYLTQRHKMLWQDQLWKDSLVEYEQTITSQNYDPASSVWLPTRQILLAAPIIGQVVAIRTRDHKMGVQSSEYFYCRDIDVFQNQGFATEYRLLAPAVWDMDSAQVLYVAGAAADAQSPIRVTVMQSDGITEASISAIIGAATSIGTLLTLLSASKAVTTAAVSIGTAGTVVQITNSSTVGALDVAWADSINEENAGGRDRTTVEPGQTTSMVQPQDGAFMVVFIGEGSGPTPDAGISLGAAFTGIITISDAGGGGIALASALGNSATITLQAADLAAQKRQRVQILGGIADGTILRILGKRNCPTFENDSDTPAITGSENCLIAFAMADLYRRERQVGKAQATAQEGAALLAQLVKEQTSQQAFKKRFVPSSGFGDANAFRPGGGGGGGFPW